MTTDQLLVLLQAIGSILAPVIIGAVFIYQNRILKTQLQTQNELISNMKAINEILDINRVKEYAAIVEETSDKKINLEKQKFEERLQQAIAIARKDKEQYEKTNLELNKVFFDVLIDLFNSPEERRDFIAKRLPSNKETYLKLLDEFEQQYEVPMRGGWLLNKLIRNEAAHRLRHISNFPTQMSIFELLSEENMRKFGNK